MENWRDKRLHGIYEIWYLNIFRKFVQKIQVSLKSDKNDGSFTWKPMYNYVHKCLTLVVVTCEHISSQTKIACVPVEVIWIFTQQTAAEDGVGSFFAGRLCLSVVRCHGQWEVCRLSTSIVCWEPCVEKVPPDVEQCFDGWKVSTVGMKLSRRNQSRPPANSPYFVKCAACLPHHYAEQARNQW